MAPMLLPCRFVTLLHSDLGARLAPMHLSSCVPADEQNVSNLNRPCAAGRRRRVVSKMISRFNDMAGTKGRRSDGHNRKPTIVKQFAGTY